MLDTVIATDIEDISTSKMFYIFTINASQMTVGEYEYQLKDSTGKLLDSGLLTYGTYRKSEPVSANMPTENIQFHRR